MSRGTILYDDTLEALNNKSAGKKQVYDTEFAELLCKLENKNPKAELIRETREKNKVLRQIYNHKVDIWPQVLGVHHYVRNITMKQDYKA